MAKKVFTTREVGNFIGVDLTTVINWVKMGKLKAYKTAGGHRRINREDLVGFMEKYSMPIPPELKSGEGPRILVVDDDPDILSLIAQTLKKYPVNYALATAADGFEAGNKLAIFKPHIVVLDMRLPGISGLDLIKKIRSTGGYEKILAMTGYGDEKTKERIMSAGADSFLAKPFTSSDFLEALKKLH